MKGIVRELILVRVLVLGLLVVYHLVYLKGHLLLETLGTALMIETLDQELLILNVCYSKNYFRICRKYDM